VKAEGVKIGIFDRLTVGGDVLYAEIGEVKIEKSRSFKSSAVKSSMIAGSRLARRESRPVRSS
jgi:hypothetical protein